MAVQFFSSTRTPARTFHRYKRFN